LASRLSRRTWRDAEPAAARPAAAASRDETDADAAAAAAAAADEGVVLEVSMVATTTLPLRSSTATAAGSVGDQSTATGMSGSATECTTQGTSPSTQGLAEPAHHCSSWPSRPAVTKVVGACGLNVSAAMGFCVGGA
jgi:hypothetical protein